MRTFCIHFAGLRRLPPPVRAGRTIIDLVVGLPKTRAAISYAQRCHAGQRRAVDGADFIEHPLEVATLLYQADAPDHVIAAGVLHDVLENTDVDPVRLGRRFGKPVAALVLAVTEDNRIPEYEERKAALRKQVATADEAALMLFAADKLSKVRELSDAGVRTPKRRIAHYIDSLELLRSRRPHCKLTAQLAVELAGVQQRRTPARLA